MILNLRLYVVYCITILLIGVSNIYSANAESPYASQQQRKIKALSEQKIQQLIDGAGMGFALPAELNGYPGPKHVIELKNNLALSTEQVKSTKQLFESMNQQAKQLGINLIDAEHKLDLLFKSGDATTQNIQTQVENIALIQSQLRSVHLVTHLKQHAILNKQQRNQYQKLRGYKDKQNHRNHGNHSTMLNKHD